MNEELEILFEVVDRFDKLGLTYMVTGSIAMAFYATPRMTRDIDIVINLAGADADSFYSEFSAEYYLDKASESELQLRDVKLLLQSVEDLDSEYLRDWATKLGVNQLLERVSQNA